MALKALALYDLLLLFVGVAALGTGLLPRFVEGLPLSLPLVYIPFGFLLFRLPLGVPAPDPLAQGVFVERLTELA